MKYKDLNLKKIRKELDLDFAHYTYQKGMCSCCYGPKDLPKSYWKNGIVQTDKNYDDINYILFKNADNGSGIVKRNNEIGNDCIEWNLPLDKCHKVADMLQEQLGNEYFVTKPKDISKCIQIFKRKEFDTRYNRMKKLFSDDYELLNSWWTEKHTPEEVHKEATKVKARHLKEMLQQKYYSTYKEVKNNE